MMNESDVLITVRWVSDEVMDPLTRALIAVEERGMRRVVAKRCADTIAAMLDDLVEKIESLFPGEERQP